MRQTNLSAKRQAAYAALSLKGRRQGLPKDADWWKRVLDVTNGRGLRPNRAPDGSWYELEEFQASVPHLLRNYRDGEPPDVVAAWLDLEYVKQLYSALKYTGRRISEKAYYEALAEQEARDQDEAAEGFLDDELECGF